jgi:hypothetical protein
VIVEAQRSKSLQFSATQYDAYHRWRDAFDAGHYQLTPLQFMPHPLDPGNAAHSGFRAIDAAAVSMI